MMQKFLMNGEKRWQHSICIMVRHTSSACLPCNMNPIFATKRHQPTAFSTAPVWLFGVQLAGHRQQWRFPLQITA
jgi:hypothetical protein